MKTIITALLLASAVMAQAAHSNTLNCTYTQASGSDPATGAYIQRAPCAASGCSAAGTFTTIATVPITASVGTAVPFTYADMNVQAGQTWWYQVVMENPGGQATPSNEVSANTPFLPPGPSGTLSITSK
jgi:hypothetical protein